MTVAALHHGVVALALLSPPPGNAAGTVTRPAPAGTSVFPDRITACA
ncbi:hypothetical protein [Neomoorella thermoacetica]